MKQTAWLIAMVLTAAPAARAQDAADEREMRAPDLILDLNRQPPKDDDAAAKATHRQFGESHSKWWTAGVGVANNLDDATDFNIHGAYSYFLVKDVEFSAELNGWYFHQDGPDAGGLNPAIVFRWHFYNDGTWTLYGDAGVGLLFATNNVPDDGTAFDFTPRVGGGFTRALDPESGTRLQVGVRWHHVSNARINGEADNPSRDGLMLYAGIQFPF